MYFRILQLNKLFKTLLNVSIFWLLILSFSVAEVTSIDAQTLQPGDPLTNYVRYLETEKPQSSLPSLNLLPVDLDDFINGYSFKEVHPWDSHPFFQNWKVEEQGVSTVQGVEPAEYHKVSRGETLYSLGIRYGVSVEDLMDWNELTGTVLPVNLNLIVKPEREKTIEVLTTRVNSAVPESPVRFYVPEFMATNNNNWPSLGYNDGALWQGRGQNYRLSAGARFSYGSVKASVRPEFLYSENRDFELSNWPVPDGISEYGYAFSTIDYPQRFGDQSITEIHPGDSWIRYEHNEFMGGISSGPIWAGPAIYNPIVLSNNAPGFFHLFMGTRKPYSTRIGNFESKLFWGRLKESGYFDENASNDTRYINGWIFNFSPNLVQGLHIGFSRVFIQPLENRKLSFQDYFLFVQPFEKPDANGANSQIQMQSLFARWQIPHYGFELYGEYTRNSAPEGIRDLLLEPEFSRGYTFGFFNRFSLSDRKWLLLNFEITQLERPRSVEFRDTSDPYYRSDAVKQGYTHRGQILGAGIGPGSNSQKIKLEYYYKHGLLGASFNRIVHDNDRLYENFEIIGLRWWGIRNPRLTNEVEFRYGLNFMLFLPYNLELQTDIFRSKVFHFRHRLVEDNMDVYNTNLQFTLRYNLPGFVR